jgi:hypothetical protein
LISDPISWHPAQSSQRAIIVPLYLIVTVYYVLLLVSS